uniref:Uncharacterized protein n=1 Tax=Glossina pallidipes TaxID=7398 RepID=A0A1B0A615_GLOPL
MIKPPTTAKSLVDLRLDKVSIKGVNTIDIDQLRAPNHSTCRKLSNPSRHQDNNAGVYQWYQCPSFAGQVYCDEANKIPDREDPENRSLALHTAACNARIFNGVDVARFLHNSCSELLLSVTLQQLLFVCRSGGLMVL